MGMSPGPVRRHANPHSRSQPDPAPTENRSRTVDGDAPGKERRRWAPAPAELLFAILLLIVPMAFPEMTVVWKCVLRFIGWILFLHLIFPIFFASCLE